MEIPRSSYYYKPEAKSTEKLKEDADLRDRIEALAARFPLYGYRRMNAQLKREGFYLNHKRVLRIMREAELLVKVKRRWTKTTDSSHNLCLYPNLYKSAVVSGINQAWVADITYIRILFGFVYLAVILDAFSRKVIGYALSKTLEGRLTLSALKAAIEERKPPPGCIHHSDRGL